MLGGSLATATAIAIGVVMTAGEPTCCAEIIANAHATGLFTAAGLRSTSGITILSVLLFMITSPIIANLQHSAAYVVRCPREPAARCAAALSVRSAPSPPVVARLRCRLSSSRWC